LCPSAPAAIAVLRMGACTAAFDRPLPETGRAKFATLVDASRRAVDEVVVARLSEDALDVMTHGGPGVRQAVNACLASHGPSHGLGAVDAEPGAEWHRLAQAPSPAAARWLLRNGSNNPPFDEQFLRRPPVILITGRSNAGKSTLLNAWCGHTRALVADAPGTTRDLVAAETVLAGWRVVLLDSAGLRDTDDPLEGAGQQLARQARSRVDLSLYLRSPGESVKADGDLVVSGKADFGDVVDGIPWSARGLPGRDPDKLLRDLSLAVLGRLRLPPS
jgi:tRNA U34 5-carboxymethylaminomethyl modifying GTPase MnmE/TrmE